MNTLIDTPKAALFKEGFIEIEMCSGRLVRFPIVKNPRLKSATPDQLSDIELSPFGLHWPQLDEDLSIRGILAGNFGKP